MTLTINNVVHSRCVHPDPGARYREYRHTEHVLSLHLRAKGRYITGSEAHQVRAPYLGLLPAGERDANGLIGPFEGYWCLFSGDIIRSIPGHSKVELIYSDASVQRSHLNSIDSSKASRVLHVFQTLYEEWRRPDLTSRLRAQGHLHELLAFWLESSHSSEQLDRARLFRDLIEQNATNAEITLADLAARVDLCPDHLAQLFQKEFGLPPVEYRSCVRLSLACELLLASVLSVREISYKCGFSDANYFARVFRSRYAISPAEYRNRNRMSDLSADSASR